MDNEMIKDTRKHFSRLGLQYFLGTLVIFAVQYLMIFLAGKIKPELLYNPDSSLLLTSLSMYIIAIPVLILLVGRIPAVQLPKRKMTFWQFVAAFCICYMIMYAGNMIGQFITLGIGIVKGSSVSNIIAEVAMSISPLTAFFLMVLCAPVIEEYVFRKLIIDRTVKYGEKTAIIFSGLMFGLFHGNLNQFAYAFLLGMFFGFLYVKTGRLVYSILLHMIINFMGSVASILLLKLPLFQLDTTDTEALIQALPEHMASIIIYLVYVVFLLGIVIAGIILFFLNLRRFQCQPGTVQIPKGKRFSTMVFNVGMLIYIVFWVVQIILQLVS